MASYLPHFIRILDAKYRFIFKSKALRESSLILLISSIIAILAGLFLGKNKDMLLLLPGMIILLPGAIDMRGSIFAAMGSRLSSDLHLGLVDRFNIRNRIIRNNIFASLTLSLVLSIGLAAFARAFSFLLGIESISLYSFIVISVFAGLISGFFLTILTFAVSFNSFRRGWDPDNVTAPLITTFGDFFTIPSLLLAAYISLMIEPYLEITSIIIALLAAANVVVLALKKSGCRTIVLQSAFVLFVTVIISSISGVLIEPNIETLVAFASLLVLLPAFIGQCGNIGNILASRLSTKMHLGTIKIRWRIGKRLRSEIFNTYKLAILIFPFIGAISFLLSFLAGISMASFISTILITTIAGIGVVTVLIFVSFLMAYFAFKFNVDPDNVIIPFVSALGDIVGVVFFLFVMRVFLF